MCFSMTSGHPVELPTQPTYSLDHPAHAMTLAKDGAEASLAPAIAEEELFYLLLLYHAASCHSREPFHTTSCCHQQSRLLLS